MTGEAIMASGAAAGSWSGLGAMAAGAGVVMLAPVAMLGVSGGRASGTATMQPLPGWRKVTTQVARGGGNAEPASP